MVSTNPGVLPQITDSLHLGYMSRETLTELHQQLVDIYGTPHPTFVYHVQQVSSELQNPVLHLTTFPETNPVELRETTRNCPVSGTGNPRSWKLGFGLGHLKNDVKGREVSECDECEIFISVYYNE